MNAPDAITRLNVALEGRYELGHEIGEGGMATVYPAKDVKHNRSVALKVLKPELAAVVGAERVLAEIETTANLQHPHILPLFDSGEADSFLFYVMPYVEGETLQERITREKQLSVDEAELFYREPLGSFMSVQLSTEPRLSVVAREALFASTDFLLGAGHPMYDVGADDQRFLMLGASDDKGSVLVQNFFEELKSRVPN